MRRSLLSLLCGGLVLTVGTTSAAPPKSSGASQKQQEDAKQAASILQEDLKQLAQAEQHMAAAMATMKKAMKGVDDAEKKSQAELERKHGLDKLISDQRAAKQELKNASAPVIAKLHNSDSYKAEHTKLEAMKQRVAQMKANGAAPEDRKPLEKQIAEAGLALTRIEQDAVENDPDTRGVKSKSAAIDKEVAALRAKIHAEIDTTEGVRTAHVELEKARSEFNQARQTVGAVRQKAGYDQAVAAREAQEAQISQMLERMKSQKGSKGKKGGKKR